LDAAVARARRSNLAISSGILLLLAASILLMLLSTRRLQALARQQLDFVAAVTHELLTPLAAMRSAGQNLADGVVEDGARVRRYGRLIDDEGRRLTRMVGQVLEFAGMQAGGRTFRLRRTALPEVIDGALVEYRPVLEERGIEVEKRVAEDLPEVMADPEALRRALQNLIANAVKYGAEGSWIGVGARCAEGSAGKAVELSVEDRGPGIDAADLPRLFEPFYRGRNDAREHVPGSGLGLSLVKHTVEGHGGQVTVETAPGKGSKLTLSLPAAADRLDGEEDEHGREV
jgi:signal transduction histidine kinase